MPGSENLGKSEALGGNLGKSEAWVREFREVGCLGAGIKGSRRPWGREFWHLRSHFKDLGFSIPDEDSGL